MGVVKCAYCFNEADDRYPCPECDANICSEHRGEGGGCKDAEGKLQHKAALAAKKAAKKTAKAETKPAKSEEKAEPATATSASSATSQHESY